MAAPAFVTNAVGQRYISWQPTAAEQFFVPAGGLTSLQQVAVGGSPFAFTNGLTGQGVIVLLGGGIITNVSIEGLIPPQAPGKFNNPPTVGNPFFIGLGANNDSTYTLYAQQTILVTYTTIPQMWLAH